MYCIKHEYVALLQNRRTEIESLKKRIWALDEFILRVATPNNLDVRQFAVCFFFAKARGQAPRKKITFHPHCHQRADGLPTGSMQVGELKLLPQIRELEKNKDFEIVSPGSACRLQIKQGAGVDAAHPLVMVAGSAAE